MLSANLSNDYFTNRQDRYHLISSEPVTTFYRNVYDAVAKLCLSISVDGEKTPAKLVRSGVSEHLSDREIYMQQATQLLEPLIKPSSTKSVKGETDTKIYPIFQLTPVMKPDTSTELPVMNLLLKSLGTEAFAGSSWMFTAGYFNMTPGVRELLLQSKPSHAVVLAASPWANGFYGSKGVSGMLPAAYTYLARNFLAAATKLKADTIKLKEWRLGTVNTPGGWSYHAKGLWVTLPKEKDPSITLIGSSNYTKRSYHLDLEGNALVVTQNAGLKKRLGEEQLWLQKHATEVTDRDFEKTERRVGLHVRIAMWIVTAVGGAL